MAHDDMIQYSGADHVQGVLERCGQGTIGLAGLRVAGGMVVNHNHYMQSIDRLPLRSKVVTRKFSSHEQFA